MFRASSAHLQEVNDVNYTCMHPLVFSFSAGGRLMHLLRGYCRLPLASAQDGHLESFEMWCWRRMEKISWTDHVRNEDVLLRVKKQRNILHEIRKWKANWIGHI